MITKRARKIILEEYARESKPLKRIPVKKTDGKYVKVGLKIKIPENGIIGLGRLISIGERDWIVKKIKDIPEIEEIKEKGKKSIKEIILTNIDSNKATIFIPSNLYGSLINEAYPLMSFQSPWNTILNYTLIPVPKSKLDKIIIIEEHGIFWTSLEKNGNFLMIEEKRGGSHEVYTLNKLVISPSSVKIIEV